MKDTTFIELLNLYVDQEISKEEVAALEQEIAASPERKKVYLQYCRMHRASVILGESFSAQGVGTGAKLTRAAKAVDAKIARQAQGGGTGFSWAWLSAGGFVAAAACMAFVLIHRTPSPSDPQSGHLGGPADSLAAISPSPTSFPDASGSDLSLVELPLNASMTDPKSALSSARGAQIHSLGAKVQPLITQGMPVASYDWMNRVQMPSVKPISFEALSFERRQETDTQVPERFHGLRAMPDRVETTAFQFQK